MKIEVDYKELRAIRKALSNLEIDLKEAVLYWQQIPRSKTELKTVQALLKRLPVRISMIPDLHEDKVV